MAEKDKDGTLKGTLTAPTFEATEVEELQNRLEQEYRTDHLTLPAIAPTANPERDEASALEREIILNPDKFKDSTKMGDTTLGELRNQIRFGIMPKDAPKEALDAIGKHSVKIGKTEDGKPTVEIKSPDGAKAIIAEPPVNAKTETPFGMETVHSTAPVPINVETKSTNKASTKDTGSDNDEEK